MKTFPIPQHWKPRDAITYFEFLHDLLEVIWETYDDQIVPIIIADHVPEPPEPDYDELDDADEIPF